ncbi:MAG: TolC family protein [Oleiphilaceae bacterium]|nr:TolC family protein [Oleiphilaceae bacterium]
MLKLVITKLILLSQLGYVQQSYADSLASVVEQAINNNLEIASAQAGLEASEYDKSISLTEFFPSLSASANTTWNESDTEQDPGPDIENEYNEHGYQITLNQRLFDLGRLFRYSQARQEYTIEQLKFEQTRQEIISSAFNNYLEILQLYTRRLATEHELDSSNALLQQVSKNVEAGNTARSSLYEAQAKVGSVSTLLVDLQKRIDIAIAKLQKDAGYRASPTYDIDPSILIGEIDQATLSIYLNQLRDSNFDILIAYQTLQKSKSSLSETRSKFSPTISADINYSYTDTNNASSTVLPATGDSDNTSYRVTLNLPILIGGERFFEAKKAKHLVQQSQLDFDNTYQQAELDLKQAVLEVNANVKSAILLKQNVQANKESFKGQKRAYELGERTLSDVLSAEKLLFDSLRAFFDTQYNYLKNVVEIQSLLGNLSLKMVANISARMRQYDWRQRPELDSLIRSIEQGGDV